MDRSLKWRTIGLFVLIVTCASILVPTFADDEVVPSWFPFHRKIKLGLDLNGGAHFVYSIDLNTAIVDRASEIERDLRARFNEEPKVDAVVRTPISELGAVTVVLADGSKKPEVEALVESEYHDTVESRDCDPGDDKDKTYCFRVAQKFADDVKKSALESAVNTVRDRVDSKGVAEPSVVKQDEQIIVELPGLAKEDIAETRDLIAQTAKLEFKVVDDGSRPGFPGQGSQFMAGVFNAVGYVNDRDLPNYPEGTKKGDPTDPIAKQLGIYAEVDGWKVEDGKSHGDYYLRGYDRDELIPEADARKLGCIKRHAKVVLTEGKVRCDRNGDGVSEPVPGWYFIGKYIEQLVAKDPQLRAELDGTNGGTAHQIGYELMDEGRRAEDKRPYWRSYYLERAVRLTGTSITNAYGTFDNSTGQPHVILQFNRFGARIFGDLTAQIVGQKLATILDDKVKSAPIINTAIRGGTATITMGGGDPDRQVKDRDALVNVLKTGSLPAPLQEESSSETGPTLGRDAIDKTKVSFGIGILLVVIIMVGIYRWSGWISVFAVVFHNLLTIAVMAVFGATLTLPGIAAIVLSVGMTVDGNILIYERIRDELHLGKSVRGAVDLGFSRAFSAILDGQLTTAAAGWVLLQYGSGPIKGFATLLLVGVFTTVTTNIWVTRIFFDWYISKKKGQLATISI